MSNKTIYSKAVFTLKCSTCQDTIYPSELYAKEYYNKAGVQIDVIQAYQLRESEKRTFNYCIECKPINK